MRKETKEGIRVFGLFKEMKDEVYELQEHEFASLIHTMIHKYCHQHYTDKIEFLKKLEYVTKKMEEKHVDD